MDFQDFRYITIPKRDEELPFIVTTVGREDQHKLYREHGFTEHQFLFTAKGEGECIINEKKIRVEPNTLMYYEPNVCHDYYPVSEPWEVYWLTFCQSINLFSAKSGVYAMGDISLICDKINTMIDTEMSVLYGEKLSVMLYELILEVNRRIDNYRYSESVHKLHTSMEYINRFYYRDIELCELSGMCGFSEEYFCRLFKKTYGVTAFSYIRDLRITEAKKQLRINKNRSISKIAESVGYHSVNYFVTDFKKAENKTPTEFRKEIF